MSAADLVRELLVASDALDAQGVYSRTSWIVMNERVAEVFRALARDYRAHEPLEDA